MFCPLWLIFQLAPCSNLEISDGKMFYGIYGDSDGDHPQVIGEASWLMARTCFPNDDLNGNSGHGDPDVTCKSR